MKRVFKIDFVRNVNRYMIISGILMAVIVVACIVIRPQLDIEFSGGAMVTYGYDGNVDQSGFESVASDVLGSISVQQSQDVATQTNTYVLSLPGNQSIEADDLAEVTNRLQAAYPDNNLRTVEITNVNPTIGREFLAKCFTALAFATILMLLFVAWRFRKIGGLSAGAMGVVALVHDCIIVFGVHVLFGIPISGNFIAVMLTILGYSLNDTIVVYDRIRENKKLHGNKMKLGEMVNLSINQSLVRCIITSVTTVTSMVIVTVVAGIYDVSSIYSFAFPLILGLISGTYSSICIAGPLWVKWQNRKPA